MRSVVITIGLGAMLSGCLTAEEKAQQLAASDDATCLSWGVQRGTPPYVQCRSQLAQQHALADAQRRQIGLEQMQTGAALLAGSR
jgi:hypothetical protein